MPAKFQSKKMSRSPKNGPLPPCLPGRRRGGRHLRPYIGTPPRRFDLLCFAHCVVVSNGPVKTIPGVFGQVLRPGSKWKWPGVGRRTLF
jgi:hypothetical protein